MSRLNVKTFTLGPFATNCYLLWPEGEAHAWLIDAGFGPGPMIDFIRRNALVVDKLILTHAHIDHIHGVREVLAALQPRPKLFIHADEREWLTDPVLNLSEDFGQPTTTPPADVLLAHGDRLTLGTQEFSVIHLPGHSPGGIALHNPGAGMAISGDTIFKDSIGRTDLPGGDMPTLIESIRTRIYELPSGTVLYPGHGPSTTVGDERVGSPFVRP
jgi:glyoxylase-like metal-dependent hydrolase (beta-lactamase superfamily II)